MELCLDFFDEVEDEDDPQQPTAEEQVTDALSRLPPAQQHQISGAGEPQQPAAVIGYDVDELDREERSRVEDFLGVGCGCTGVDGGPCSRGTQSGKSQSFVQSAVS